jgi:hypothetical protein
MVKKGAVRSLLTLLSQGEDAEGQRFSALALANCASSVFNRITMVKLHFLLWLYPSQRDRLEISHVSHSLCCERIQVEEGALEPLINYIREETSDLIGRQVKSLKKFLSNAMKYA